VTNAVRSDDGGERHRVGAQRSGPASHDADAHVEEIRRAVDEDDDGGSETIGIGRRGSGAEHDDACAAGAGATGTFRRLAGGVRGEGEHDART
jgi:hypothetical protein